MDFRKFDGVITDQIDIIKSLNCWRIARGYFSQKSATLKQFCDSIATILDILEKLKAFNKDSARVTIDVIY